MHAARIIIALAAGIAGCRPGGGDDPDPTVPGETGEDAACGVDWSGDATTIALPAGYPEGAFASPEGGAHVCADDGTGLPTWWRADLTGDGLEDLVVTRDCADDTVGDEAWRVHPGGPDGFGQGIVWALPGGFSALTFTTLEGDSPACEYGVVVPAWHLRDMDGDGRVDLVTTHECVDTSVGDTTWKVYPNTGEGFGSGVSWALPGGFASGAFVAPRDVEDCGYGANSPAWDVADLDADGRPDLVTTDECVDLEVGASLWHLWRNEGDGFSSEATAWALPTGLPAPAFAAGTWACDYGDYQPAYFLRDMDGDGGPDLVSTFDCIDLEVGDRYWNVFRATGAGFEDIRAQWRLPDGYSLGTFRVGQLAAPSCVTGAPAFALRDVDADALPDIVVTAACADSTLGDTQWRVHENEGDGFASAPVEAALPLGHSAYAFRPPAPSAAACAGTGDRPAWALWDSDGDGREDIVLTEACDDPTVGDSVWLAHRGACIAE